MTRFVEALPRTGLQSWVIIGAEVLRPVGADR